MTVISADTMRVITNTKLPYLSFTNSNRSINWSNIYRTQNPHNQNLGSTLTITKINCRPLYLCQQATKNTHNPLSDGIEEQPLFQKLTDHEKNIIYKEEAQYKGPFLITTQIH
jgi:hypothetical protein